MFKVSLALAITIKQAFPCLIHMYHVHADTNNHSKQLILHSTTASTCQSPEPFTAPNNQPQRQEDQEEEALPTPRPGTEHAAIDRQCSFTVWLRTERQHVMQASPRASHLSAEPPSLLIPSSQARLRPISLTDLASSILTILAQMI